MGAGLAKRILFVVLTVLLCASCDVQKMIVGVTPEQDLALAHRAFDQLRHRDFAALQAEFDPKARKDELPATLEALAGKLPDDAPVHDSVTAVHLDNTNGHRSVALILLYQFPTRWVQFDITTEGDSVDAMAIESLDVTRLPIPPTPVAGSTSPLTTPLVLAGIALWLVLMLVIYRRYIRKAR
jgi:hypothetical protein